MVKLCSAVLGLVLMAIAPAHVEAQSLRYTPLNIDLPQLIVKPSPPASAALHPAAKGALIGAAAGAGAMGAFAWWFCTKGPGECSGENVAPGLLIFTGIGAGVGALIGALK